MRLDVKQHTIEASPSEVAVVCFGAGEVEAMSLVGDTVGEGAAYTDRSLRGELLDACRRRLGRPGGDDIESRD
jgi:hypothetical protein